MTTKKNTLRSRFCHTRQASSLEARTESTKSEILWENFTTAQKKRKRKEKGIDTFLVQEKIKEYSVFITNIYLHGKMLVLPYIWECIQKDTNIISNVWKSSGLHSLTSTCQIRKANRYLWYSLVQLSLKNSRLGITMGSLSLRLFFIP